MSSEVLNTPTEGDPTASLGSLLQGLTILTENNFFLIPNGNFPRCNSCPLSCCFFGSAPVSPSPLAGSYLGICKRWQTSHAQIHQVLRKRLRSAAAHEGRGHMGWESVPALWTPWSQPWPAAQPPVRTRPLHLYGSWQGSLLNSGCFGKTFAYLPPTLIKSFWIPLFHILLFCKHFVNRFI